MSTEADFESTGPKIKSISPKTESTGPDSESTGKNSRARGEQGVSKEQALRPILRARGPKSEQGVSKG